MYIIPLIWKQNRAHFPHIIKNLTRIAKKDDTLNPSIMGEMKSYRFPHSTEIGYKKTCTIATGNFRRSRNCYR